MVLAAMAVLASLPFAGPVAVLAAMAALDFPVGSQDTVTDFVSGGGWALLLVGVLVTLGVGLYALRRQLKEA